MNTLIVGAGLTVVGAVLGADSVDSSGGSTTVDLIQAVAALLTALTGLAATAWAIVVGLRRKPMTAKDLKKMLDDIETGATAEEAGEA